MGLLDAKHHRNILFMIIGSLVASMSLYNLIRTLRRSAHHRSPRDRSGWLPLIASGIGTEVGLSSAGAGALGSVALLNLTPLTTAEVVGTDVMFGLVVSLVGGGFHLSAGHFQSGNSDAPHHRRGRRCLDRSQSAGRSTLSSASRGPVCLAHLYGRAALLAGIRLAISILYGLFSARRRAPSRFRRYSSIHALINT